MKPWTLRAKLADLNRNHVFPTVLVEVDPNVTVVSALALIVSRLAASTETQSLADPEEYGLFIPDAVVSRRGSAKELRKMESKLESGGENEGVWLEDMRRLAEYRRVIVGQNTEAVEVRRKSWRVKVSLAGAGTGAAEEEIEFNPEQPIADVLTGLIHRLLPNAQPYTSHRYGLRLLPCASASKGLWLKTSKTLSDYAHQGIKVKFLYMLWPSHVTKCLAHYTR